MTIHQLTRDETDRRVRVAIYAHAESKELAPSIHIEPYSFPNREVTKRQEAKGEQEFYRFLVTPKTEVLAAGSVRVSSRIQEVLWLASIFPVPPSRCELHFVVPSPQRPSIELPGLSADSPAAPGVSFRSQQRCSGDFAT
jgi:hypothetical protein